MVPHVWTDHEKKKYNAALQKYGRSFKVIAKLFPALTYRQINDHAVALETAIKKDKNHPDAHLKKLLKSERKNYYWT